MREPGFWTGTFDRAIKSFTQALLMLWGADEGLSLLDINLVQSLGVAGAAAVLSILTSIVSAPIGEDGTTSLLRGGR